MFKLLFKEEEIKIERLYKNTFKVIYLVRIKYFFYYIVLF